MRFAHLFLLFVASPLIADLNSGSQIAGLPEVTGSDVESFRVTTVVARLFKFNSDCFGFVGTEVPVFASPTEIRTKSEIMHPTHFAFTDVKSCSFARSYSECLSRRIVGLHLIRPPCGPCA